MSSKKKAAAPTAAPALRWVERDVTPKRAKASPDAKRAAFLKAILESPDDDGARLVYADWLQQEGDPRGELIAIQCELWRADNEKLQKLTPAKRKVLEARQAELLKLHKKTWVGDFTGSRTQYGVPGQHMWVKGSPTKWDFERGFVVRATMSAKDFGRNAEAIFAAEPLQCAHVTDSDIAALTKSKAIGKLKELDLERVRMKEAGTQALFKSKAFTGLKELAMRQCRLGEKGAKALAKYGDPKAWPSLQALVLSDNGLGDKGAIALASAKLLSTLKELHLDRNNIRDKGALALAESPHLKDIGVIYLWGNKFSATTQKALEKRFGQALDGGD